MGNSQIVSDILRRKLIKRNQDISDILGNYSLTPSEQEAIDEYVTRIDQHLEDREQGSPSLKAYWDEHRPTVNKAKNYLTIAGTLAGGVAGYFLGGDAESTLGGAVIGGVFSHSVEVLFGPLEKLMGVPDTSDVVGSLKYISKAREEALNSFNESRD